MNMNRSLQIGLVICGSVLITALGIDAFDTAAGSRTTLLGQLIQSGDGGECPAGMVAVPAAQTFTCVDIYEASPTAECPHAVPQTAMHTQANLSERSCGAAAVSDVHPWTYVTREQAAALCTRAGKRLPTAAEWHSVAVGSDYGDDACVTDARQAQLTGSQPDCVSEAGVYDAVGNVWEWVSDDVFDGQYNDRALPASGYVSQVDAGGVPTNTTEDPIDAYYGDYFWSAPEGTYGMIRGGFYGSRTDAGVYAVHAHTDPNSATRGIGFRCVL